jgi:hypothetical protein
MKKLVLLSSLLLSVHFVHAQVAIKLYQNLDYVKYNLEYGEYDQEPEIYLARTSLAIQFSNREDLFQEVEFSYAQVAIPVVHQVFPSVEHVDVTKDYVGMQYELNKVFGKGADFRFSLGGGALLYGLLTRREPQTNGGVYLREDRYIGTIINLIPRIQYDISKRFIADLNFKLALFDVYYHHQRTHNLMLPMRQQREDHVETDFFPPAYNVRIGLGYRL